jgi:predicted branched-subunit amino acid permease
MTNPLIWNITSILPEMSSNLGNGNNWMLYALGALVLGILIGGLVKGAAKLVLGVVMLSGFVVLVLLLMQRQDILTMIASVVFGLIMLVASFLAKVGKYPIPKR